MRFVLNVILTLSMMSGLLSPLSAATDEKQPSPRLYLGARLNAEIPELLRKHLRLEPDQGLLVENIFRNSPADKAGLDKDDILLTFEGMTLKNAREFYRSLREFNAGKAATIKLIHLGQPKQVVIILEAVAADFTGFRMTDKSNWKYPLEADESVVIRPGRMFHKQPGEKEWVEVPLDQLTNTAAKQPDIGAQYHFLHDDGQKEFTVVIAGNPAEPNALIAVKTPDKEYFSTADQIDKLPQGYQQTVRYDIEKAKQSGESRQNTRIPSQVDLSRLQEFLARQEGSEPQGSQQRLDSKLETLTKQMQQMEDRQKELETYLKEKLGATP
jgi:hypothetical protein